MHVVLFVTDSAKPTRSEEVLRRIVHQADAELRTFAHESIKSDIYQLVHEATVVVAHIARSSPNVLYEIGLAHGMGKPVILLVGEEITLPFDLRSRDPTYLRTLFRASPLKPLASQAGRASRCRVLA